MTWTKNDLLKGGKMPPHYDHRLERVADVPLTTPIVFETGTVVWPMFVRVRSVPPMQMTILDTWAGSKVTLTKPVTIRRAEHIANNKKFSRFITENRRPHASRVGVFAVAMFDQAKPTGQSNVMVYGFITRFPVEDNRSTVLGHTLSAEKQMQLQELQELQKLQERLSSILKQYDANSLSNLSGPIAVTQTLVDTSASIKRSIDAAQSNLTSPTSDYYNLPYDYNK